MLSAGNKQLKHMTKLKTITRNKKKKKRKNNPTIRRIQIVALHTSAFLSSFKMLSSRKVGKVSGYILGSSNGLRNLYRLGRYEN